MKKFIQILLLVLIFPVFNANAVRIKDIVEILGVRQNQLVDMDWWLAWMEPGMTKNQNLRSSPWQVCWKKWV